MRRTVARRGQLALRAEPAGVDDQAVGDLLEGLHDPVEVARAHADAAPVEGGVGAAVDDAAAVGEDLHPVAVAPHAGEVLEVRGAVPRAVRVAAETDRHRRHRLGDDELALLADQLPAVGVERGDRRAEVAARDLALPHRREGTPADERRAHVGTTGDR